MGERTDEIVADETTAPEQVSEADVEAELEAAQIRSDIEQTRAEMGDTIDALQQKLDPSRIAEQVKVELREKVGEAYESAKQTVKEATIGRVEKMATNVTDAISDVSQRAGAAVSDTGSSIVQVIRENPLASTLVGVGLGMMLANARSSRRSYSASWDRDRRGSYAYPYSAGDRYSSAERFSSRGESAYGDTGLSDSAHGVLDTAKDAVSSAASSVKETAGNVADATREQVSHVADQARYGARAAGDWFQATLQENPLVLGIAALAAGAIVGLSFPSTRVESQYMGQAADQVVDRAKSLARDTAEKVQHVAQEAGRTMKDAAQKEGLTTGGNNEPAPRV